MNLFADLPNVIAEEIVDVLVHSPSVRVERIISTGHTTPDGQWYDQDENEWVIVLKGQAELLFDGDDHPRTMNVGDHIMIPAHHKHRVTWTSPDEPTVWLAVFFD
ncbi:MAG: cupin domain-containing protein [Planctomycetales bacterium]|nr:cupin domain-containing protein [Planctomycetales bacterium]